MKKRSICSLLIAFLCVFSFFPSAAAQNTADLVVNLQIDNPIMQKNGQNAEIDPGRDTAPVISNGRTLVPIRAIIEAFGGTVSWNSESRAVALSMDGDTVTLVIDSTTAYLNGKKTTLDVAPAIIRDRTMLPLRFVAEGFSLGVAWNPAARTVSVIRNGLDAAEYQRMTESIPAYSGQPYAVINQNIPYFNEYEIIGGSFEFYSKLDDAGRVGVCFASVAKDIMPTEDRGSIQSVTPTGWQSIQYDCVESGYLYNRCHLLGHQLTGENTNKRNLFTGTRYLNMEGMLPFENRIFEYAEATGNHVMYRVTPLFRGNNLIADGVLLEAQSVEDNTLSFCVYCYNVQPNIYIDYATGDSFALEMKNVVYRTPTGKRYHSDPDCGGKNSYKTTLEQAKEAGLTPCSKCA